MDMNKSLWIASAIAAAVSIPIVSAGAAPAVQPPKSERCFGIVKAGHNDCQTMSNSCAGTAKADNQKETWVYLPIGVCAKLSGASLQAKQ
jgi:uncharacterized membrane protein